MTQKVIFGSDKLQICRTLETVYILLEKGRVTAKELAIRFGVSARTIYRDLDALSAAGIPVYAVKGHGGGISLLPDFAPGGPVLSAAEKEEITAALSAFGAVSPDAHSALQKLSSLFADAAADWVEADFAAWSGAEEERAKFDALKKAVIGRKIVTFVYYSAARGAGETRRVCPLKLCFRGQSWYLYGRCEARGEDRFFKLRRIRELNVTDARHTLTAPGRVTDGSRLAAQPPLTATLAIDGSLAYRVYDDFGEVTQGVGGELMVTAYYTRPEWLFALLVTYGEACRIVSPLSLRAELKKYLTAMLKNCD